jgi:hypothetical protein
LLSFCGAGLFPLLSSCKVTARSFGAELGGVARGINVADAQSDPQGLAIVNPIAKRILVRIRIDQVRVGVRLIAGITVTVDVDLRALQLRTEEPACEAEFTLWASPPPRLPTTSAAYTLGAVASPISARSSPSGQQRQSFILRRLLDEGRLVMISSPRSRAAAVHFSLTDGRFLSLPDARAACPGAVRLADSQPGDRACMTSLLGPDREAGPDHIGLASLLARRNASTENAR